MMMILWLFSLYLSWASTEWANVKCPSNVDLAKQFVEKKLSGDSVYPQSKCWQQEKFPAIHLGPIFSGETTDDKILLVTSYSINEVKAIGEEVEIELTLTINNNKKVTETIRLVRLDESPNKAFFGCAMDGSLILERPYLLDYCR